MADTMDHPATATRNTSVAGAICLLAVAPQIFELIWSLGTIVGWGSGRGPGLVLVSHVNALLHAPAFVPGAVQGLLGGDKKALSSDVLLALVYSYPVFAVAILTMFVTVRSAQDYVGGVVLMAFALFSLWASSDLQGIHGFSFGAGTAPRMFGVLLLALAAAVALMGLLYDGAGLSHYSWRGPLFVMGSVLFFALSIRPLGLIVTAFVSFMIAAMGTHETRWRETLVVGIALTVFCSFLFPYGLGLPMPMWPRFLVQ